MDDPDLAPHVLKLYQEDPCMLLRNIGTMGGLVKGRLCWAVASGERLRLARLDNQQELTLPRTPMEKVSTPSSFQEYPLESNERSELPEES
jgi:hypothetical protein